MSDRPRTAIVTGAAGGLGRALAVRLARDGWSLVLADIDDEGNRATAAAVQAVGGRADTERLDVADCAQWQALHDRLRAALPNLDLLVNNAGIAAAGEVGEMPLDRWRRVLDVNLSGVIHGCHTFVPWLKRNPAGAHVVNVASFAAFASFPEMAAYNVTKAGVVALSETMRAELAADRVGVTAVCPGFFATGLARNALMQYESQREFTEEMMRTSPITADQVAAAIVRAVAANEPYVILPARARRYWFMKRFFPKYFLRQIARRYQQHKAENDAQS